MMTIWPSSSCQTSTCPSSESNAFSSCWELLLNRPRRSARPPIGTTSARRFIQETVLSLLWSGFNLSSRPHTRFFVCWMRTVNPGSSPAIWRAGCVVTLTGCILCVPGLEVSLLALSSPGANKQILLHFLLRRSIRSKCCELPTT